MPTSRRSKWTTREVARAARRWGWTYTERGGGHAELRHPAFDTWANVRSIGRPKHPVPLAVIEQMAACHNVSVEQFMRGKRGKQAK